MNHARMRQLLEEEILRKIALAKAGGPVASEHLEVADALKYAVELICEEEKQCGSATRLLSGRPFSRMKSKIPDERDKAPGS